MKIARLVFILVLLVSAVVVPNKTAAAVTPQATISITASKSAASVGDTIVFTVTFNSTPATTTKVEAKTTVSFAEDAYFGDLAIVSGNAVVSGKTVVWEDTLFPAGTKPVTFKFSAKVVGMPAGVASFDTKATAQIVDKVNPGTMPTATDSAFFTLVSNQASVGDVSISADKTAAAVGEWITFTAKFHAAAANVAKVAVKGTVTFPDSDYVGNFEVTSDNGVVSGKSVSWEGFLNPDATVTVVFKAQMIGLPADLDVFGTVANATLVDTANPGTLPTATDSVVFNILQMQGYGFALGIGVEPANLQAGDTMLVTVILASRDDMFANARVSLVISFLDDKYVDSITVTQGDGATVNGKTVTWTGVLQAGGANSIMLKLSVKTKAAPAALNAVDLVAETVTTPFKVDGVDNGVVGKVMLSQDSFVQYMPVTHKAGK